MRHVALPHAVQQVASQLTDGARTAMEIGHRVNAQVLRPGRRPAGNQSKDNAALTVFLLGVAVVAGARQLGLGGDRFSGFVEQAARLRQQFTDGVHLLTVDGADRTAAIADHLTANRQHPLASGIGGGETFLNLVSVGIKIFGKSSHQRPLIPW